MKENILDKLITLFCKTSYPIIEKTNYGDTIKYTNDGILSIFPKCRSPEGALILSVGVHGDETGPVEVIYNFIIEVINKHKVNRPLMIILGNIEAIKKGVRYIDEDLNRAFDFVDSKVGNNIEQKRALIIAEEIDSFKTELDNLSIDVELLLDLHCFVYPDVLSIYEDDKTQFAVCVKEQPYEQMHEKILSSCGVYKVITNIDLKGTLVSYIAKNFSNILTMVFELGHANKLGENNLLDLKNIADYLYSKVCNLKLSCEDKKAMSIQEIEKYRFCGPVIKSNESFQLNKSICLKNFTKYDKNTALAYENDELIYKTPTDNHTILFPWPSRPIGSAGTYIIEKL